MRWIASDPLNRFRFPAEEWRLVEMEPSLEDLGVTETLFAVGNGYLGLRCNPEEGRKSYAHGTFINGFHRPGPSSTRKRPSVSPAPAKPSLTCRIVNSLRSTSTMSP